jgi:hypothetical protein
MISTIIYLKYIEAINIPISGMQLTRIEQGIDPALGLG